MPALRLETDCHNNRTTNINRPQSRAFPWTLPKVRRAAASHHCKQRKDTEHVANAGVVLNWHCHDQDGKSAYRRSQRCPFSLAGESD